MGSVPQRETPEQPNHPDLGALAARLLFGVQDGLYEALEAAGFADVTRLHGAVFAHLDEEGTRSSELARRSGRHKQVIGRIVDELESLGYVERRPEPADRRAKLVVPTERGVDVIRMSDEFIGELERRQAQRLGRAEYDRFKQSLRKVTDALSPGREREAERASIPHEADR
ncbi:MAG: MarR family transcriptional regulator [Actinomycetota bacterium]|nr:MarR family transcriptional regulator [Actinomycetota bacterium]